MSTLAKSRKLFGGFAGKSILSLLVKVSGALATYLFLLAFANQLGPVMFGVFAFGLSVANFGVFAAGFGQPMLTLRNLSYALAENDAETGRAVVRFGLRATLMGALASLGGMAMFGAIAPRFGAPDGVGLYFAATALLVALVAAEFLSHLQRAFGVVVMAIAPKDLVWRLLCIGSIFGAASFGINLGAVGGLWLVSALLGVVAIWQGVDAFKRLPADLKQRGAEPHDTKAMRKASLYFWGIAVSTGLAQHLTVVAVGFGAGPETIGAFFAAFRTASLLSMPLTAANIVLAPIIARHYKDGRTDLIQKVVREFIALAAVPTLIGLAILVLWGDRILGLFDESYAASWPALIVFALGFLVNTLTGPCGYVMMMSGAESLYLRYTIVANIIAVIGAGLLIGVGMPWAAAAIALANTGQNLLAARWTRRKAGIESTVACLW